MSDKVEVYLGDGDYIIPDYFPLKCPDCGHVFSASGIEEKCCPGHVRGVMDADPDEYENCCPKCGAECNGWEMPSLADFIEWIGEDEIMEVFEAGLDKLYGDHRTWEERYAPHLVKKEEPKCEDQ